MGRRFKNLGIVAFYMCLLFGISLAEKTTSDYLKGAKTTATSQPGRVVSGRTTGDYLRGTKATAKPLLIKAFEDVISSGKKNDWKGVKNAVDSVQNKIVVLDKTFNTMVSGDIDKSFLAQDIGKIINLLANAVYLAIFDELKLAASDNFTFADRSLEHIEAAQQYYEHVLSVNITRKDPNLDKSILSAFEDAVQSVENADEAGYDKAVQAIESSILRVYVKFQQKKSDAGAVKMEFAMTAWLTV